jgi:hypothetical protein
VYPLLLAGAVLFWSTPAVGQAPDRQSDKAVSALISQVESARDKFESSLDGSLKNSLLRSPTGEVMVSAYLQDLQDNIGKLKDRYTPGYAASAELEVLLKQGNAIDAYMQATPSIKKGRSEWEHMAATLKSLAGVYGATFPLPPGAVVRRMSDTETAEAVNTVAESANQFKKAMSDDKAVGKPDQESAKKLADDLNRSAKVLKSRLDDGKPASAELKIVLDHVSKLDAFALGHPSMLSTASMASIKTALVKIQQSFGVTPLVQ